MTDMHREAFERHAKETGHELGVFNLSPDTYRSMETDWMWIGWQAALRYRNEPRRNCAYMCKFCRDEQEKQA